MMTLTASDTLLPRLDRRVRADALRHAGLRALFARMAAASQGRATRREVAHLSDRLLRDIGLTRGDLDAL